MSSRTTLKQYFLTGKKPTQQQFADLIDSLAHLSDLSTISLATLAEALAGTDNLKGMSPFLVKSVILDKIINDLTTGGVQKMLSAEQGKLLDLRVKELEKQFIADADSIINTIYDITEAFNGIPEGNQKLLQLLGLKADKNASNLTASDISAWLVKLGVLTASQVNTLLTNEANTRAQEDASIRQDIANLQSNRAFRDATNLTNIANWQSVLGIKTIRLGSTFVGDIATDKLVTCTFSAFPNNQYTVCGSLVGVNQPWDNQNDVMWVIVNKTASNFQIAIREVSTNWQELWFEFALIKW